MVDQKIRAFLADYPERLSVEQVAEILGATPRDIRIWLREGRLPGYKLTRRWMLLRSELEDWLEARAYGHGDPPRIPEATDDDEDDPDTE